MRASIAHIESFYSGQKQILDGLRASGEISLANELENVLAKSLVIACASYFEEFITSATLAYASANAKDQGLVEFCKKASQRQYHSWFDWEKSNANKFLGLFGDSAKQKAADRQKADEAFEGSVTNFMFLGSQRNLIVHRNMLAYAFSGTSDEVMSKARAATAFVDFVAAEVFALAQ